MSQNKTHTPAQVKKAVQHIHNFFENHQPGEAMDDLDTIFHYAILDETTITHENSSNYFALVRKLKQLIKAAQVINDVTINEPLYLTATKN